MSAFSNYTENAIVNHLLRNTTFTSPASTYVALFTTSAGLEDNNSGAQDEIVGSGYSRVDATAAGGFTSPTNGATSNAADLVFPTATADWGVITHIAIMDAPTSGNVLFWGPLSTVRTVLSGDSVRIRSGEYDITVA